MWSLCFSGSGACAARDVDHGHSNKVPYNYQCLGGSRAGAAFSHPAPARGDVHTGLSSGRSGGQREAQSRRHQCGFWQQLLQPQRCYQRLVSSSGQAQTSQAVCLDFHCLPPSINFSSGFLTGRTLLNTRISSWAH